MTFIIVVLIITFVIGFLIVVLGSSNNGSTGRNNIHDQETTDLINEALRGSPQFQRERKERLIHDREVMSITSRLTEDGFRFYRYRNDREAIKCFEKCLEYSYPSWAAFYKLMDIYRERKDYKNEIRVIERSIEILENDNAENGHISEYPIQPLIERLVDVELLSQSQTNKNR